MNAAIKIIIARRLTLALTEVEAKILAKLRKEPTFNEQDFIRQAIREKAERDGQKGETK